MPLLTRAHAWSPAGAVNRPPEAVRRGPLLDSGVAGGRGASSGLASGVPSRYPGSVFRFLLADVTKLDAGDSDFGAACIDADDLSDGETIRVDERQWRVIEVDWSTLDPTVEPPTVLGFVEPARHSRPCRNFRDVAQAGEDVAAPETSPPLPRLLYPSDWN
jgi:hypothetical protein